MHKDRCGDGRSLDGPGADCYCNTFECKTCGERTVEEDMSGIEDVCRDCEENGRESE